MAGAILLGWLVVKTSVANGLAEANPYSATKVAPNDPRVAFEIAMSEFMTRGGRVTDRSKARALAAATKAPLSEVPFLLASVDAIVANDRPRGERLLLEARRRDPRSSMTRLLLLDAFLRRNKITEATQEITALANVAPETSDALIGELARLVQTPSTSKAVEEALRRNPIYRDRLLEHLALNKADPDLVIRLANSIPGKKGPAPWQERLLTSISEQGDIQRAYSLWRTFYAPNAPEKKVGVYDPQFRGLPGAGPFGWSFPASPAGIAERTPARTLQVDYYGRDQAELATQLLMLPPGPYRLSIRAEGDAEGEGSKLSWKLECRPSKTEIADLTLRKLTFAPRVLSVSFAVPASGCSTQSLRLVGSAGEFPKGQNATISAVQIEPGKQS